MHSLFWQVKGWQNNGKNNGERKKPEGPMGG
jgi:hypothetical protein